MKGGQKSRTEGQDWWTGEKVYFFAAGICRKISNKITVFILGMYCLFRKCVVILRGRVPVPVGCKKVYLFARAGQSAAGRGQRRACRLFRLAEGYFFQEGRGKEEMKLGGVLP